jgi:hypothetical protein
VLCAIRTIKLVSCNFFSFTWALGKYYFVRMSSSTFACADFYVMTLISEVIKRKFLFSLFTVEAAARSVIPQVSGGRPVC